MAGKNNYDIYRKEIGRRLKKIRMSKGFTQEQFVDFLQTGRANLSRVEKGDIFPNYELMNLLRQKFHIRIDWFLFDQGTPHHFDNEIDRDHDLRSLLKRILKSYNLDDDVNILLLIEELLTDDAARRVLLRAFCNHRYRDLEEK